VRSVANRQALLVNIVFRTPSEGLRDGEAPRFIGRRTIARCDQHSFDGCSVHLKVRVFSIGYAAVCPIKYAKKCRDNL
jgi:hypothetical protein